ncbi:MAG TPA: magnesium/cobalt transporter CorA [Tepidisphaeraceae bacterium]|nr:magnesium/cobalt transporter CorA [Tepidisphaeraceae bacterium]
MVSAFIKFGDGRVSTDAAPANIRAALRDAKAVFWVDIDKPTDEEYGLLDDVFGFHPLAIEDSIQYSQRPKIESYRHVGSTCTQGYFYMVIHGPDLDSFREKVRTKELDMFVSERFLVTIHEERMSSIAEVRARAEADAELVLDIGIDRLLHNILDRIVDHYVPILEHFQEEIDELEELAITEPTPDVLHRIAAQKRELLNFRRIIAPQRDVIAQLTRGDVPFIREATRVYLRDVLDHLVRAVELIELYRDVIVGARDIYMSSVSNNLNQVMKTLTVITVIALPLNIITGFFGMNFDNLPGIHTQWAFWITLTLMVIAIAVVIAVLRTRRWL